MYDDKFFEEIKNGSQKSAEVVAQLVYDEYHPEEVIDVGCGQGWWGQAFENLGATAVGIDGEYVENNVIPLVKHDISQSLPNLNKRYDLAICLEVAEHLPESRAASFVSDLCEYSDTILFSAAIPYQTGTNHINCQWLSYWVELFEANGYGLVDYIRWQIWNDPDVESWYKQNIVVFEKGTESEQVFNIVHPEIHYWGRS